MKYLLIALMAMSMVFSGTAYAEEAPAEETALPGDIKKGKKVFNKCKACHTVGKKAKNKVGPLLNGIVGRDAGTVEGFKKYSKAMMAAAAEGLVWTPENIDAFITKPKDFMKGTKMAFRGLKKQKDRENVIAYLNSFSADGTQAE